MTTLKIWLVVFILTTLSISTLQAQSIQLYGEDFENAFPNMDLTSGGVGANLGSNQWLINSAFTGVGGYSNTYSQDSTFGGTISGAPYSRYLHIQDNGSAAMNANFNPGNASDRFAYMTGSACTYGFNSVNFSFFYTVHGSSTAYAEVYYRKNGGPWTQTGATQYNDAYKWRYEIISNPDFVDASNLQFAFRWINDAGTQVNPAGFAVDDIRIVGFYSTVSMDSIHVNVLTDSVCQGTSILANIVISDTLCDGNYILELSDATGNFPNALFPPQYYIIPLGLINFFVNVPLPANILPGNCYKIRFSRDNPPPPPIVGIASACFTIYNCPNTITTIQPAVTRDSNAVCINSVIDVPFFSTGVFVNNLYSAQLSDSNGVFPSSPPFTILGTLPSDANYPASPPGSISGVIPNSPNVPPGCNYYIRVKSSNPLTYGVPWGPFCIQKCDIETNNKKDISVCLQPTSQGWDSLIRVDVNHFDSIQTYLPGNRFTIELRNSNPLPPPTPWGFVNTDSLGWVTAVNDTTIHMVIPPLNQLVAMGINPGSYYMRINATNAANPENAFGTVVRLTIGAPTDIPPTFTSYNQTQSNLFPDTICVNDVVDFWLNFPHPNQKSTYIWNLNGTQNWRVPGSQGGNLALIFNGAGTYVITVTEENFGCVGTSSASDTIVAIGPPSTLITAPLWACVGDTIHLTAPNPGIWNNFFKGDVISQGDDELFIRFDTASASGYIIRFDAQNFCGSAYSQKSVKVVNPPLVAAQPSDTTVCTGSVINASVTTGSALSYCWVGKSDTLATTASTSITPDSSGTYFVTVRYHGVCPTQDSIKVDVRFDEKDSASALLCPAGLDTMTLSVDYPAASFYWSTGNSESFISIADTGTYWVDIKTDTAVCKRRMTYTILPKECIPLPSDSVSNLSLPNVFSPDGSGQNDFFTPLISGPFDQFQVEIYNRWGNLIYGPASDPFFQWDGNENNGNSAPAGVYFWLVNASYKGVKYPPQRGFVTLIRGNN